MLDGREEEQNYTHLLEFGLAPGRIQAPVQKNPSVRNLEIISSTESLLNVAWEGILEDLSISIIMTKPSNLGEEYFVVIKPYLRKEINSYTIMNLAQGQSYAIRVIIGDDGIFEPEGVEIVGTMLGDSLRGNNEIDVGEVCDEEPLNNDFEFSNCTYYCVLSCRLYHLQTVSHVLYHHSYHQHLHLFSQSSEPSNEQSLKPSLTPSPDPSVTPSDFPSLIPSITPSFQTSSEPPYMPSNEPSLKQSLKPSSNPLVIPSGSPSLIPSTTPSLNPTKTHPTRP